VNERLEEPRTEEALPELPPHAVPGETVPQEAVSDVTEREQTPPTPAWEGPSWLRMAYALEFLLAMIAIFTVWSEVGGQGHMDLLPWYIKLGCSLSLAWCSVRFTAAIVEHEKAWNQHTAVWFMGLILVAIAMGSITYYYHLHEVPDEPDNEDNTSTSITVPAWPVGQAFPPANKFCTPTETTLG
jgi:hypothetical protein